MKTMFSRLFACLMCVVLMLSSLCFAEAEEQLNGTCGENLTWRIEGNTLYISGTGPMEDYKEIRMPRTDGESGSRIGVNSPWYGNRSFDKVVVEEGVTTLGNYAFFNKTAIVSVSLPETLVSIGKFIFGGDGHLKDINLPDSITCIGQNAFSGCHSLRSLSLPASLEKIEFGTFQSCDGLSEIRIPDSVTSIDRYSFYACIGMDTVLIPASVTEIAQDAFGDCRGLKSIIVVNGSYAEQFCKENGIKYTAVDTLPEAAEPAAKAEITWNVKNGILTISGNGPMEDFEYTYDESSSTPGRRTVNGTTAPWDDEVFGRVIVEEGITSIGKRAFYNHKDLKYAVLPDSLLYIEAYAFDTTALEKITIPGSVRRIGANAFDYCLKLKNVTLPESIEIIEGRAFVNCTRLEHVNLPASLHTIEYEAFDECGNAVFTVEKGSYAEEYCNKNMLAYNYGDDASVHVPVGNTSISWKVEDGTLYISGTGAMDDYNEVFGTHGTTDKGEFLGGNTPWDNEDFSRIVIENGITSIGKNTFRNRYALVSVSLPDTLESIGEMAFGASPSLEEINLSEGLTSIGANAFVSCSKLKNITLPDSLKEMDYGIFQNCTSLKEIRIPESITTLGAVLFSRCTNLEKVIIPASVTKMEPGIFRDCENLIEVIVEKDSCAMQYCIDNNLPYTIVE